MKGVSKIDQSPLSNLGLSEAGPGSSDLRRSFNAYTFLVVAIGAIGGLVFGMDIGATGASLDMDGFREEVGWPLLDEPGMPTCGPGAVSDGSYINNKVCTCCVWACGRVCLCGRVGVRLRRAVVHEDVLSGLFSPPSHSLVSP